MEFLSLHTLVIGVKFLKEFGDKIKSGKNSCFDNHLVATTLRHKNTSINPYDNG